MKRAWPFGTYVLLAAGLALSASALAQEAAVKAEIPVLVTSSGQALDAFTVKTLLARAGVTNEYKPLAQVADLKGMKSLIIAFGASIKGFGTAGITTETELSRTEALLRAARAQKVLLIGVHIGGADRRGGLSKQFVELVTPRVDYLVVWEDGNADGYFTKVGGEKKIPLTLLKQPIEVGRTLAKAFGK